MSENDTSHAPQDPSLSATEKLAALVAQRKAKAGTGDPGARGGRRGNERAAAALSASKSKPALRK